jgi:hypothetical protein
LLKLEGQSEMDRAALETKLWYCLDASGFLDARAGRIFGPDTLDLETG